MDDVDAECCDGIVEGGATVRAGRAASMTIDGDDWSGVPSIPIENVAHGSAPATSSDLEAEFSVLWDEDALYVSCSVTDDQHWSDSGDRRWHDDALEVFLDLAPSHEGAGKYDEDVAQI